MRTQIIHALGHLPDTASPDASDEAWGLGTQEGASACPPKHFGGREFDLNGSGGCQLLASSCRSTARVLASGPVPGIQPGPWHAISLGMTGSQIIVLIDGQAVATVACSA